MNRYTIELAVIDSEPTPRAHRQTAISHLRAAELFAYRHFGMPLVHVKRYDGEPSQDGCFQAYYREESVGAPFLVTLQTS